MRSRVILCAAVLLSAAMLGVGLIRVRAAAARGDARSRALVLATDDARQVLELAAAAERVAEGQRPEQDVIARVSETLGLAGVPARVLTELREDADVSIDAGPPELRRQTVAATLEPITLDQLASFLGQWRETQSLWTLSRIDVTHKGKDDEPTLSCRLVFAATYVAGP